MISARDTREQYYSTEEQHLRVGSNNCKKLDSRWNDGPIGHQAAKIDNCLLHIASHADHLLTRDELGLEGSKTGGWKHSSCKPSGEARERVYKIE